MYRQGVCLIVLAISAQTKCNILCGAKFIPRNFHINYGLMFIITSQYARINSIFRPRVDAEYSQTEFFSPL